MFRNPTNLILLAAAVIAVIGAQPHAGGWNDGSRLAAVESLAERGTLAIDDSVFVCVPPRQPGRPTPYIAAYRSLMTLGTLDKLLIDGHYYSDKSPVPTVLIAAVHSVWLVAGGPTFAERVDVVCRFLTVTSSGAAYVFAVWCVIRLGRRAGLTGTPLTLLTGSFAFATVALPYTQSVNNHEMLLAAIAGICVLLSELDGFTSVSDASQKRANETLLRSVAEQKHEFTGWLWNVIGLGTLAGLGYTIDLGAGPPLLVAVGVYLAYRLRRIAPLAVFALAALPWLVLHHVLNYATGGTIGPANAVPEYLSWPGSPFTAETMTGGLKHDPVKFVLYALDLLVGKKGIISNNMPLWLATAGAVRLWLWSKADRPAVAFAAGWCGVVWLLYSATSNNFSGQCVSVRWFVPFLAPGFWVLARLLAAEPKLTRDLAWLTAVGACMTALMWRAGPWMAGMVPGLWGWMALAAIGWAVIWRREKPLQLPRFASVLRTAASRVMIRSSSAA